MVVPPLFTLCVLSCYSVDLKMIFDLLDKVDKQWELMKERQRVQENVLLHRSALVAEQLAPRPCPLM